MLFVATLLGLLLGSSLPSGTAAQSVQSVTLSAAWTSIPLPATPMTVVEHDGTLWVAGFEDLIAQSTDGGAQWTVLNHKNGGQILTRFVFIDAEHFAVFGTAGVWYESENGGRSWKRRSFKPATTFSKFVFPDRDHGFAIGATEIASTKNGGKNWRVIAVKSEPQGMLKVQNAAHPEALIAWDAAHALVLIHQDVSDTQSLVLTRDGGAHWTVEPLDKAVTWSSLQVQGEGFRIFGSKAPGTPVAASAPTQSTSSFTPEIVDKHAADQAPGHLIADGAAWRDLRGSQPTNWAISDDADFPLTGSWAASGDSFCRVASVLRCRKGEIPWTGTESNEDSRLSMTEPAPTYSPDPEYNEADRDARREGNVIVEVQIGTDGRVQHAIVTEAVSAGLALKALESVWKWRFKPATRDGQPVASMADVQVNFRLY